MLKPKLNDLTFAIALFSPKININNTNN